MHIVLYEPQIPQNTGNIVRTCACTGACLLLVPPLGFKITDRWLKRAGLDYWEGVLVRQEDHFKNYLNQLKTPFYFFSSKATKCYTTIDFSPDDHLIFGSETAGLPLSFHEKWPNLFYKIPMEGSRCSEGACKVRFRRFLEDFWPIFALFGGGNIRKLI